MKPTRKQHATKQAIKQACRFNGLQFDSQAGGWLGRYQQANARQVTKKPAMMMPAKKKQHANKQASS